MSTPVQPRGAFMARPQRTGAPAPAPAAPAAAEPTASPFKQAWAARAATPLRRVVVPMGLWDPAYVDRPREDVEVGLRLYSENEAVLARAAAAQRAWKLHPQPDDEDLRVAAYNGGVMARLVAVAICDPADATINYFGRPEAAEANVPFAFTPAGVEFLFDELEALLDEQPTNPEATDDDIAWLAEVLTHGAVWNALPVETARRVRRLLGRVVRDLHPND